jgi:hypothetical protein
MPHFDIKLCVNFREDIASEMRIEWGHAVAPAVSSRSRSTEVPVQSYASLCRLRVGQCGTGAGFFYKHCGAPYSFKHPSPTLILLIIWQCLQLKHLKIDYHTWKVGRFLEGCGLGVFGANICQESEKFCEIPRLVYPITRRRFKLETFRVHYFNTATSTCPEHPLHSKLFPYF